MVVVITLLCAKICRSHAIPENIPRSHKTAAVISWISAQVCILPVSFPILAKVCPSLIRRKGKIYSKILKCLMDYLLRKFEIKVFQTLQRFWFYITVLLYHMISERDVISNRNNNQLVTHNVPSLWRILIGLSLIEEIRNVKFKQNYLNNMKFAKKVMKWLLI